MTFLRLVIPPFTANCTGKRGLIYMDKTCTNYFICDRLVRGRLELASSCPSDKYVHVSQTLNSTNKPVGIQVACKSYYGPTCQRK